MKISITFTSDTDTEQHDSKRKKVHKKPWFWLLIILIASAAFRFFTEFNADIPVFNSDDEDLFFDSEINNETDAPRSVSDDKDSNEQSEKLETTEQRSAKARSIFHFIVNTATKKYHTRECSAAKKLVDDKRLDTDIEAESLEEAKKLIESQGYEMCGICDR